MHSHAQNGANGNAIIALRGRHRRGNLEKLSGGDVVLGRVSGGASESVITIIREGGR